MSLPKISAIVSFSRELRNAREFKSISLEQIESVTCIARQHLEALESAHWDEIPAGFLRGYIALYAGAVGMNSEKVLRDFDGFQSSAVSNFAAQIVRNKPLLDQPERVGLTRAKIAAAWFADLTARTHLKKALLIIVIVAIIIVPAWMRNYLRPSPPEALSIKLAMNEYRKQTHGPQTTIPLEMKSDPELQPSESTHWLTINTVDKGQISFIRDQQDFRNLRFSLLETINIQYINNITFEIKPALSASFILDDSTCSIDTSLTETSALYRLTDQKSAESTPDSVSAQRQSGH